MPKIIVRDGESLEAALQRLRKCVNVAYRRQFYKGRVGCYEKPSDKRRRAKRAGRRRCRLRERYGDGVFTVYMSLRALHSRGEDPFRT